MSRRQRLLLMTALVLAIGISIYAARGIILTALGTWLDVSEKPRPADYVMILTGEENSRPYAASTLIRAGYARKVLVSNVYISPAENNSSVIPTVNEIIRRVVISRGVAAEDLITLPGSVESTFDEACSLAAFLKTNSDARVLIVTNHFHTRRARLIFFYVLGNLRNISFISAPMDGFQLATWWRTDMGFINVIAEYCKLSFYIIRYGYAGYLLAGGAILFIFAVIYLRRRGKIIQIQTSPTDLPPEIA